MTTLADGSGPATPERPSATRNDAMPASAHPTGADKQLHAQNSDRVYQAAGNQYIYDHRNVAPAPVAVNTLPRGTSAFTGRDHEIRLLVHAVVQASAARKPIAIHTIDGMPGVGKTAFAVHVGHLLAHRFPDGQLFVDLHAHTAGHHPVDPTDALFALLAADGVHPEHIPAGLDQRAARWRARAAGKKLLLLLDNAAGHQQVEPLLPAASECLVVITSRRRLTGLHARHAATTLSLDILPPDQSATLFTRLTGRVLTGADTAAVAELVRLCGHLPLAISLLATRLRPRWTATHLLDELTSTQNRLAYMRAEDIAVAAAFDLSYRHLSASRRRFFRRLSLHPGSDIDAYAAAALDDISVAKARRHLDALYHDHLLDQSDWQRYRMHDLVRVYARAQAAKDPANLTHRAIDRLLGYYQHTAGVASRYIAGGAPRAPARLSPPPAAAPMITNLGGAMTWMNAERANMLACAAYAHGHGNHAHVVGVAAAMTTFIGRTGPWRQAIALHEMAADAARHLNDSAAEADALRNLGTAHRRTGDYAATQKALDHAQTIYRGLGDRNGRADALNEIAVVHRMIEDYPTAIRLLDEALSLYQQLDNRLGQAETLSNLSVLRYMTNDYPAAADALHQALAIYHQLGARHGQATALHRLGFVRSLTDDYPAAARAYHEALAIHLELGDRLGQANDRLGLGTIRRMTGDYPGAAAELRQALALYTELGDRLGQANAHKHLGIVQQMTSDLPQAVAALRQALVLYRELHDRLSEATALNNLGIAVWQLSNDFNKATAILQQSLAIYTEVDSELGRIQVLNNLGTVLLEHNDVIRALDQYRSALGLAQRAQSPCEEAHAHEGTARCALRQHDTAAAIASANRALEIYQRIGAPEAGRLVTLLAEARKSSYDRQLD
jgi:tetratricopeptide (TPR) repeat protein